ncbi:hypothetical protein Patl1_08120 [Pistacia atlantica]|uniref:Uncharacterized protein n=1 Tax=Pistacia atlantica TaxID=434234 RepID=A0ACC1AJT9_9ROSI|nr:hypothetical protein Patl1_08120 [Pistacia atlantica]
MASAVSTLASAAGARALAHALPRALLSTRWSCSKMGVNASAAKEKCTDTLPEPLTGKVWKLEDFEAYPALLVIFICNHCPFVKHLKKDFVKLANYYMEKGLAVVAISSNSVATHPSAGNILTFATSTLELELLVVLYKGASLFNFSHKMSHWDFGAVCTPEFFLYKKDGRRPFELVYHGQFDDSRPSNNLPVHWEVGLRSLKDICGAIECVLSGQPVSSVQKPRYPPY